MPAESSGYKRATALELARLLVRFDHVAHMLSTQPLGDTECVSNPCGRNLPRN
jgi:hypothetical protein